MKNIALIMVLLTLGACTGVVSKVPVVESQNHNNKTLTGRLSTRIHTGEQGVVWALKGKHGVTTEVLLSLSKLESKFYKNMASVGLGSTVRVSGEMIGSNVAGRLIARELIVLEP